MRAACAGLTMAACLGLCAGQAASSISLSNGVQLKISTNMGQPNGGQTLTVSMTRASGEGFYRVFRDQNGLAVFAYELSVSLSSEGDSVRLHANPVETEFAAKFPNADGGKPVPTLSSVNELSPLSAGGRAEIGLFELQGMGLRVIDSVEFDLNPESAASPGRLRLAGLELRINGAPLAAHGPGGAVAGRYAMIYVPGRGAYVLSSQPVADRPFVKAGSIDGNKLKFQWNNDSFEVAANAPILASSEDAAAAGEVWVYFDPSYQPAGNWTQARSAADHSEPGEEFFASASDSLGWWLP